MTAKIIAIIIAFGLWGLMFLGGFAWMYVQDKRAKLDEELKSKELDNKQN